MGELMNNLKELSELAWQGDLDTKFEHHPVHTFMKVLRNLLKIF
jgi:hypothetical protein